MVRQTILCALIGFAMLKGIAQGVNIYVTNKCDESIVLAHVTPNGVTTDDLASGGSITKSIASGSGSHVFKSGTGAEATLAEFSTVGGKCWYDISCIPTGKKSGPGYCTSLEDCKAVTGGVGFNVPLQISPHTPDGDRCVQLTCLTEDCADAYLFPKDDTKTHTCPLSTDFDVTFCPGGSGGSPPATKPAPAPVPAPSPSPSPTVPNPTPSSYSENPSSPTAQMPLSPESTTSTDNTSPSSEKTSSSPSKQSSSLSLKQTSSPSPDSAYSPDEEQQTVDQFEELPVPKSETEASKENLRKDKATTVPSATPQHTTETNQKTQTTGAATGGKNPAAASTPVDHVQQISTRSDQKDSGGTLYALAGVGGVVAMVAVATIVMVRKKKAQLDELETKTPQSTTAHGPLANFRTPRNNVSVLYSRKQLVA